MEECQTTSRTLVNSTNCPQHDGRECEFLCDVCQVPVCAQCIMSEHKHHGFRCLAQVIPAAVNHSSGEDLEVTSIDLSYLENMNSILLETMSNLEEYGNKLKEILKNLNNDATKAVSSITSHCDAYIKCLEEKKHQLIKDIETFKNNEGEKMNSLAKEVDERRNTLCKLREILLKNYDMPDKTVAVELLSRLKPTICEHLSVQYPSCHSFECLHYDPPFSSPFISIPQFHSLVGSLRTSSISQLPKMKLGLVIASLRSGSDFGYGPVGSERRKGERRPGLHAASTGNIKEELSLSLNTSCPAANHMDDDHTNIESFVRNSFGSASSIAEHVAMDFHLHKENMNPVAGSHPGIAVHSNEFNDLAKYVNIMNIEEANYPTQKRAILGGSNTNLAPHTYTNFSNNDFYQNQNKDMYFQATKRMNPEHQFMPPSGVLSANRANINPTLLHRGNSNSAIMPMMCSPIDGTSSSQIMLGKHPLGSSGNILDSVGGSSSDIYSRVMSPVSVDSQPMPQMNISFARTPLPGLSVLLPRCMDRVSVGIKDQLAHCMKMTHLNGFTNLPKDGQTDFYGIAQRLQTLLTSGDSKSMETIPRVKMVYINKWGEWGVTESQFSEPNGVAVLPNNRIAVADTNSHRIQVFTREGNFSYQFPVTNRDDGVSYPNCIAVNKATSDIVITERSPNHQVQVYTATGQFIRRFGSDVLESPRGVAVDRDGRILVVECKVMRVSIFNPEGYLISQFHCTRMEFPNSIAVDDRYRIYISDNRAHCIRMFNYIGERLGSIGCLGLTNYPIGVAVNEEGNVVVADNHNNFNVTIFNRDGFILQALESRVKHAQCYDMTLLSNRGIVLTSKDYRVYCYELPAM